MSLTDIMSHAGYVEYAIAALVLFVLAFLVIVARTFAPGRKREMDESSRLPLDDDGTKPPARKGAAR